MPIGVKFTTIEPIRLRDKQMRLAFLNPLRDLNREMKKLFEKTTATWEVQPVWKTEGVKSFRGNTPETSVYTDDRLYRLLNNGTNSRPAHMTDPFEAKTSVRELSSQQGVGHRAYIDVNDPKEGIDGRFWDEEVAKVIYPRFFALISRAAEDVARVSGNLYTGGDDG